MTAFMVIACGLFAHNSSMDDAGYNCKPDQAEDDPGKEIDLYVTGALDDMVSLWMGDCGPVTAISDERIILTGPDYLLKSAKRWFSRSRYTGGRPKSFQT